MAHEKKDNLKQLQSERTRRNLIGAATKLMLRKGYSGTTIALLASESGVTKGAIYHHFANKEAILRAVIEHVRFTWEQTVGARIPAYGDAIAQLGALFDHQAQLINEDPTLCLLINGLMLESEVINQEMMAEIHRIYDDLTEYIRVILDRGQGSGAVRQDVDAKSLARSIVAIISGISCSQETDPSAELFTRKMQTTKIIVLSGIQA